MFFAMTFMPLLFLGLPVACHDPLRRRRGERRTQALGTADVLGGNPGARRGALDLAHSVWRAWRGEHHCVAWRFGGIFVGFDK